MLTMLPLLLGLLCLSSEGDRAEPLSREEVTIWVRLKLLEGLGVEEPPLVQELNEEKRNLGRSVHRRRPQREDHRTVEQEEIQIILFANSGPSCAMSVPGLSSRPLIFQFQPSVQDHITSAQLWFFSGFIKNFSAPVSMLTSGQRLLLASSGPSHSQDGWSTYDLKSSALRSMGEGPFWLQVDCVECQCVSDPDKTPFLNIMVNNQAPRREPRSLSLPWSPSVVDLLQRPSQEAHGDCNRAHIEISFEELGWDSWIVDPKTLSFYYCQGNCSSPERSTAQLGMTQCCAPVPGSMRSIRITTTSDGGYSFKYETLPNIMPEECACI